MILIIGGTNQGKLDFALKEYNISKSQVLDCKQDSLNIKNIENIKNIKAINGLNFLVKHMQSQKTDLTEKDVIEFVDVVEKISQTNKDLVIISDEVGYGIVPMEKKDREYREISGRACCEIARKSDKVYRIVMGIPQKIK